MPSTEKKQKSELVSVIDSFLDEKSTKDGEVDFLSIIDFIDRFKLLPNGLYPAQKFILKLYYNIPLDSVDKTICLTDKFNTKVLRRFTEVEYLEFLYNQGRCNIKVQDKHVRHELILVLGRRSGKSALSAIISAYELYKLLRRRHPQAYYGLPSNSEIRILCVANDKEQASIVYGDVSGYVDSVDYFKSAITNQTQTFMKFQTDNDRQKFGPGGRATLTATFKSSIAKGLRGRGVICYILDEIAFFVEEGKSSAANVYKAVHPSIAQFSPKNPKNKQEPMGPSDGRSIMISSPDAKSGFFYKKYQSAMSGGLAAKNILMIQAPTWEINPTLDRSYYEGEFSKDPDSFMTEHGAEFSDRVRGWIDTDDLIRCISPSLKPIIRGSPRELFWAGVDFAVVRDGTSIAIVHFVNGKIELAYHEVWYAGKDWYESNPHLTTPVTNYSNSLRDVNRLDIMEIAEWFKALSQRFYIDKAVFDQWAGPIFEQELHKRGLKQFEMRNFSTSDSSYAFHTAKMCMYGGQLSLYDYPIPEQVVESDSTVMKHSPLITELSELQATSGGKNITIVEAPEVAGKHDDMSDALVRAVLMATEHIKKHPGVLDVGSGRVVAPLQQNPAITSYRSYHAMRRRMHGHSPVRSVPVMNRLR